MSILAISNFETFGSDTANKLKQGIDKITNFLGQSAAKTKDFADTAKTVSSSVGADATNIVNTLSPGAAQNTQNEIAALEAKLKALKAQEAAEAKAAQAEAAQKKISLEKQRKADQVLRKAKLERNKKNVRNSASSYRPK